MSVTGVLQEYCGSVTGLLVTIVKHERYSSVTLVYLCQFEEEKMLVTKSFGC